jgi:transposase-like protein
MHYIYIIQKKDDYRLYIGQTISYKSRWRTHIKIANQYSADKKNSIHVQHIHKALAKYGIDAFEFYILQKCKTQKEANEMERFWIEILNARKKGVGFNSKPGGQVFSNPELTKEKRKAIFDEYLTGQITMLKLAEKYKCSSLFIKSILLEYDENIKIKRDWGRVISKEQEKEICKRYLTGQFTAEELSKMYGCTSVLICRKLTENNIEILGAKHFSKGRRHSLGTEFKKGHSYNRKFTDKQEKEICDKYTNERVSVKRLSIIFGCNRTTIFDILKRRNIPNRGGFKLSEEEMKSVIRDYLELKSFTAVSKKYGVSHNTISRIISKHNKCQ